MSKRDRKPVEPQSATVSLEDDVENVWLKKLKGKEYEMLTIPFWAYNLSLGDIVEGGPDEDGVGLFVRKVIRKSGNRTVRVAFKNPSGIHHPAAPELTNYFKERDLKYTTFGRRFYAVNVPSEEEYKRLLERLQQIPPDAEMIWEDGDPQPDKNMDGSNAKPTAGGA